MHKDHYGYLKLDSIHAQKESYQIDGVWLRVKYKDLSGYVLSTFLYRPEDNINDDKYKDYVLLIPGGGCSDNIHNINNYNWYGVYQNEDESSMKKINFNFYNTLDRMINMQIIVEEDRNLAYIIGSKKPLNIFENRITSVSQIKNTDPYLSYPCDTTYQITKDIISEYSVEHLKGNNGKSKLFIKNKKGWQALYPFSENYNYSIEVLYSGDIDSDGKEDYIISYGAKPGCIILYLTSEARKGDMVKDVAAFYFSFCC